MGRPYIDLTGERFGKVLVVGLANKDGGGGIHKRWLCRCDCGTEWMVASNHLISGEALQCKKCRDANFSKAGIKHGCSHERLYHIWLGMRKRCYNTNDKSYNHYGGRGIKICNEWGAGKLDISGYLAFKKWAKENGYKEDLSIDRIDVDGPYSPENCRWATFELQCQNKTNTVYVETDQGEKPLVCFLQTSEVKSGTVRKRVKQGMCIDDAINLPAENGRFIEFNGKRQSIRAWALEIGMNPATLLRRVNAGWEVGRAIMEPVHKT